DDAGAGGGAVWREYLPAPAPAGNRAPVLGGEHLAWRADPRQRERGQPRRRVAGLAMGGDPGGLGARAGGRLLGRRTGGTGLRPASRARALYWRRAANRAAGGHAPVFAAGGRFGGGRHRQRRLQQPAVGTRTRTGDFDVWPDARPKAAAGGGAG